MLDYSLVIHMATLYVENVPEARYEALRDQAKRNRKSIAAEVISLLEMFYPTKTELEKRRRAFRHLDEVRRSAPLTAGPFPSAEELIREDRER
jgi:Antitoxin FitA-like, ribbon-helix-helix